MTDKQLSLELKKWFNRHLNDPNRWNRSFTGKIIYNYLNQFENK
jgi:hypothetical protein